MEIGPGVHLFRRTATGDGGGMDVAPAAVELSRGVALVDVGFPDELDVVERHLADAGFGWADVRLILVTHHDDDHAGGVAGAVEQSGAAVLAHGAEVPYLAGEREPLKTDPVPPASVDVEVGDGVVVRTAAGPLRVVETPGHSPGHLSAYLPAERLLLAGDALTAPDGVLSGPMPDATPDMAAAARSVGRLAALDVERTVCYHGGLVEAGSDRIREIEATIRE